MFVPFLSQGLCTNEAENTVKLPLHSTGGYSPFTNYWPPKVSQPLHLVQYTKLRDEPKVEPGLCGKFLVDTTHTFRFAYTMT